MNFSTIFQSVLLAAVFVTGSNAAVIQREAPQAYCPKPNVIVKKLNGHPAATSFCSWYLPVQTKTATVYKTTGGTTKTAIVTAYHGTATITVPATTKTKQGRPVYITTTITEDVTVTPFVEDVTITVNSDAVPTDGPIEKRYARAIPPPLQPIPSEKLKAACSCLKIPKVTKTATLTKSAPCSTKTSTKVIKQTKTVVKPTITRYVNPTSMVTVTETNTIFAFPTDVPEEENTPSTPEGTNPEDTTPEEGTPEESTPEESTPEENTPEESTPEESTPEEATTTED